MKFAVRVHAARATLRNLWGRVRFTHPTYRALGAVFATLPTYRALGAAFASLCLVGALRSPVQGGTAEAEYLAGTPFTYLFDTGTLSPRPLPARSLAEKRGWTLVPEEAPEHKFHGDVVLLNDKLTVVLRRQGPGAEVYCETAAGAKPRAILMSIPRTASSVSGVSSIRIIENTLAAVTVEATFQTDGSPSSAGFRLTTGQSLVETSPASGAERLFVWSKTRYVVVPDFFGDDMVFSAGACDLPRFGLPAENFLLNLLEGGDSIVMCVWGSRRQEAHAILAGEGPQRAIRGCEIQGEKDKTLWVAFLEQPDIWHERLVTAEDAKAPIVLDWKPPFEARWRADLPPVDCMAESWELRDGGQSDEAPLARRDYRPGWHWPCQFEKGRAVVRLLSEEEASTARYPGAILVYPIDRSRGTPLTAFCPIDVLRNTLGVGPCQYILQSEGLASETNPTPDNVMDWVEDRFSKNKEVESADQIKTRLAEMIDHVGQLQARIGRYVALGRELRKLCRTEAQNEALRDAVQTFIRILDEMDRAVEAGAEPEQASDRAARLAELIVALIGKDDALAECRRLGGEIRRIGATQDRELSKCRMAMRWLKKQAQMSTIRNPRTAELAEKIRAGVERLLEHD